MQSNPVKDQNAKIVVRVNIPVLNLQKAIKVGPTDLIWTVKKQLEEKVRSEIKDILNYALFLHGQGEKQGKYLDERKSLGSYHVDSNSQLDFILKTRVNGEVQDVKKQRRIIEDIQKGNLDKLKEKTTKNVDFNFLLDQDTPLSLAVMNNDPQMIEWLLDNGAFSDFRVGDKENWKAPIHLAALHNKALALKVLLQYAAWPDILDALGLSAIHYAVTAGNSECVLRLLLSKADTEIFDEHGRRPLHQAALNNFDCIVALLIDFGSNIHAANVGGNTPLHVAASRNSKESTKWLLMRGADTEKINKSGKTPLEVAQQAQSVEVCDIISKFKPESIIPPPPPQLNYERAEVENIVQHVLSSLSASIGGEYRPEFKWGGPTRHGSSSTSRKPTSNDNEPHHSSGLRNSDSRKSLHKSLFCPPPPNEKLSVASGSVRAGSMVSMDGSGSPLDRVKLQTNASLSSIAAPVSQPTQLEEAKEISPPKLDTNVQVIIPSEDNFEMVWKKFAPVNGSPMKAPNHDTPQLLVKLKNYVLDKANMTNSGATSAEILNGLNDLEFGFIKAYREWEHVQQENEQLTKKLKDMEAKIMKV